MAAKFGQDAAEAVAKMIGQGATFTESQPRNPDIIIRATQDGKVILDIVPAGSDRALVSLEMTAPAAMDMTGDIMIAALTATGHSPDDPAVPEELRERMKTGIDLAKSAGDATSSEEGNSE